MVKRSKRMQILQTTLSVIVVIFSFVLVFFIKCMNNVEYTGYFLYNEKDKVYEQLLVYNVNSIEQMNNENYIYRMDNLFYKVSIEYETSVVKRYETKLVPYETVDELGNITTKYKEETVEIEEVVNVPKYTSKIIQTKTFSELPKDVYKDCLIVIKIDFFSKENFKKTVSDASYWVLSIAITLCLTVAYTSVYYNQRATKIESDGVQDKITKYNDKVSIKPTNFDEYARLNNLDEKKKVYKKNMTEKLSKLKGKLILIPNEKLDSTKAKKLKLKIEAVERQLTDEYINDNILGIKVKYEAIHPENYRVNAYDKTVSARKDFSDEAKKFTGVIIRKVITSFISAALFSGLVMTCYFNFALDGEFWLIMITTAWGVMCQVFFGYRFANSIVRTEIEVPLENKTVILQDSIKWALLNHSNEKSYEDIMDEYLKKRIDEAKAENKAEYDEKLNTITNKFNELKKQTIIDKQIKEQTIKDKA